MGGFLKKTVKYALVRANLEAKKIILKLFFLQFRKKCNRYIYIAALRPVR